MRSETIYRAILKKACSVTDGSDHSYFHIPPSEGGITEGSVEGSIQQVFCASRNQNVESVILMFTGSLFF